MLKLCLWKGGVLEKRESLEIKRMGTVRND